MDARRAATLQLIDMISLSYSFLSTLCKLCPQRTIKLPLDEPRVTVQMSMASGHSGPCPPPVAERGIVPGLLCVYLHLTRVGNAALHCPPCRFRFSVWVRLWRWYACLYVLLLIGGQVIEEALFREAEWCRPPPRATTSV